MNSKSATRYAQALLELATEQKNEDVVEKDMLTIQQTIHENADFRVFLKSPLIKEDKKKEIMAAIFGKSVSEITLNFLLLLIDNQRDGELKSIANAYVDLFKKQKNLLVAELTSVSKIDAKTKNTLSEKIKSIHQGEIEWIEKIDAELLGGFILKIDDRQLDTSISKKLRDLRKELILN